MGIVATMDRPVEMTRWWPAATTAVTASRTAGERPPLWSMVVPSRSRATRSGIRGAAPGVVAAVMVATTLRAAWSA